jgi:hypothetical protein
MMDNKFLFKRRVSLILEFTKTPIDMTGYERWLNEEAIKYEEGAANKLVPDYIKTFFRLMENPEMSSIYENGVKYILHRKYKEPGLYKILVTKPMFLDRKMGIKHANRYLVVEAEKVLSTQEKVDNFLKLIS